MNFIFLLFTCSTVGPPTPAPRDVCVFFVPNKYVPSMPISKISLHGWWPEHISGKAVERVAYLEFLSKNLTFPFAFYDTTTWKENLGCGQYREYIKHGFKSGYTFEEWYTNILKCDVVNAIFPHQCVFL